MLISVFKIIRPSQVDEIDQELNLDQEPWSTLIFQI